MALEGKESMMNRLLISTWLCLWLGVGSATASIPVLQLDFNHSDNNTAAETESGFTPFVIGDSGNVINGIKVEIAGNLQSRRRGAPAGVPFEQIYRDFIFGYGGMTVTLSGLLPGGQYEVTIYAFDTSSANLRVADWMSGGERVLQARFLNTEPPAAADHYAFSGLVSANANGTIVLEAVAGEGTVEASGATHPFAFLNALVLSLVTDTSKASIPHPASQAVDVPRDTVLRWTPGQDTVRRDVYLGTTLAAVEAADRANPGDVLVGQGQTATMFDPGLLEFGQTYYWRIDEIDAGGAILPGSVWSFTVESVAIPLASSLITATASSSNTDKEGPEKTVDGSGLNAEGHHATDSETMWLSGDVGDQPTWIQYEFDKVYPLHQMLVWNHNTGVEAAIGLGVKEAIIDYSLDGIDWATLGTTHQFARATGLSTYAANTTIEFGGVAAKYVRINIVNNWGGFLRQAGLSEVRFQVIPAFARQPVPASGADGVDPRSLLSWRAGRYAVSHEVYLSTDEDQVVEGTALAGTTSTASLDAGAILALGQTYYWKVNEVNDLRDPSVWEGEVWSFSTNAMLPVDDMESYDDAADQGTRIYEVWVDGEVNKTGSQVGYMESEGGTFGERGIVHSGRQSMPLYYDNTATANSEATRTFDSPQDWTQFGVKGLTLWFSGDPENTPGQLYVKVNGSKVLYDGDAENLRLKSWQIWYVDLARFTGVNLKNVTTMTIGLEGGKGLLFIDDIGLSPFDRQLVTPAQPATANLVARYAFEGNANDSAGTRHGTVTGAPQYVAGKTGQAIKLDGARDFVLVESSFDLPVYTAAVWFRVEGGSGDRDLLSIYDTEGNHGVLVEIQANGNLRFLHRAPIAGSGGVNIYSTNNYADGVWYHAAVVKSADRVTLYVNGQPANSGASDTQFGQPLQRLAIGVLKHDSLSRFFPGTIDEVYLYNRVLSDAEIGWLAGRTKPYDKP
jgi:hypothetical protein